MHVHMHYHVIICISHSNHQAYIIITATFEHILTASMAETESQDVNNKNLTQKTYDGCSVIQTEQTLKYHKYIHVYLYLYCKLWEQLDSKRGHGSDCQEQHTECPATQLGHPALPGSALVASSPHFQTLWLFWNHQAHERRWINSNSS